MTPTAFLLLATEGGTFRLRLAPRFRASHTDGLRVAFTLFVILAVLCSTADRHGLVRTGIVHRVGRAILNFGKGGAAGLAAVLRMFSIDLYLGAAAAVIPVACAMNDIAFQFGHHVTPLRKE